MKKIDNQSAAIGAAVIAVSVLVFKLGQNFIAKRKEKKKTTVAEQHKDINPAADVVVEATKVSTTETQTA